MPFEEGKFETLMPQEKKTEEELALEAEEKERREYEELKNWYESLGPRAKEKLARIVKEAARERERIAEEAEKTGGEEVELSDIDKEVGVSEQEIKEVETKVEEVADEAAEKGKIDDSVVEKAEDLLGAKPETETIEQEQDQREKEISELTKIKEVGLSRLRKVEEGLAYLAAPDRIVLAGLKEIGKFAVKSGKTLGRLGLSPLAGIENRINKVIGIVEFGTSATRKWWAEAKIKTIEEMPEEERTGRFHKDLESAREISRQASENLKKAMERYRKKGLIARFIERYFK